MNKQRTPRQPKDSRTSGYHGEEEPFSSWPTQKLENEILPQIEAMIELFQK